MDNNFIPYTFFPWKGKTLTQITSFIQKNKVSATSSISNTTIMNPQPLKIYRREIASKTPTSTSCNSRISTKIDRIDGPNGYIISDFSNNGLVNTLDINTSVSLDARPNSCNTNNNNCMVSTQENALRRIRSSGMNKPKFSQNSNNNVAYCTSTAQYLVSRSRTFSQNQYINIRKGDSTAKPGDAASQLNEYATNGISHCSTKDLSNNYVKIYYKPNNSQFAQQGAVTSSSLIARKKYDTITTAASKTASDYGNAAANALAYGVSESYTIKTKTGYSEPLIPTFPKYTDKMQTCSNTKIK